MPSQIAHVLVGEAALHRADPEAAGSLLNSSNAPFFRLGCQGPDIFYHSQHTRPYALHYGVLVHRRGFGRLINAMADLWAREDGNPGSPWSAYLLGFATHAALDRAAHPFIVYFSGWVENGKAETLKYRGCHALLERVLDILMWERVRESPISNFNSELLLGSSEGIPPEFSERMARALGSAYPGDAEKDNTISLRVANAFSDTRRFYVLTNPGRTSGADEKMDFRKFLAEDRDTRILSVLYPLGLSRSVDWANERGAPWLHPSLGEPEDHRSFRDLCDEAEKEASRLLGSLLDGLRAGAFHPGLEDLAGNGTLNISGPDGRSARPVFSNPLPLPELMDQEFRIRMDQAERIPQEAPPTNRI